MQKYRDLLTSSIHKQVEQWQMQFSNVTEKELYQFLHSIKGTSSTIGMIQLSDLADALMGPLNEYSEKQWTSEQLQSYLLELMTLSRDVQSNHPTLLPPIQFEIISYTSVEILVLILDDDATLLMYLKEQLEKMGWTVLATVDPEKALTYIHDMQPDCFITDLHMPKTSGFRVISVLRDKIKRHLLPTTIISADNDKHTRLQVYRMGADDYLPKPLDIEELIVRVERQLERKKMYEKMLFVDELTGAYNRKYLQDAFTKQCAKIGRKHTACSVALVDLDRFKRVNDMYGHLTGDLVLKSFSSFMKKNMRENDSFIRYGGEEFVIIMDNTEAADAKRILERQLHGFSQVQFDCDDGTFSMTFSAGITEVLSSDELLIECMNRVDQALYQAKNNGRNKIEITENAGSIRIRTKIKIAVIHDNDSPISENIKQFFSEDAEVDVRTFSVGEAFINDSWHTGNEQYLIILDHSIPHNDSLEVLQTLRKLPHPEQYWIVMITGLNDNQAIVEALRYGVDDYISKPFSNVKLDARLKRHVHRMRSVVG